MPGVATKQIPVERRSAGLIVLTDGPRGRGRPARLSRPAILDKALELIDSEGAEALTMRRLGAELGVEAMSLYRHVANKRALLDGIAERLMDEVGARRGEYGGGWEASALSLGLAVRAVAQAHPDAFELVGARALNTYDTMRPIESLLSDLRAGGFAPAHAVAAHRLLVSYIRGFALVEIAGFTLSASSDPARLTPDKLPAEEFPTIRELADELVRAPNGEDFRAGIETIIAGLRRELETASPQLATAVAEAVATPRLTARARARARS